MKSLGLNPGEQEMIDITNEVAVNGLVYFPDFCSIVRRKYREESKELFNQTFFKVRLSIKDLMIFREHSKIVPTRQSALDDNRNIDLIVNISFFTKVSIRWG